MVKGMMCAVSDDFAFPAVPASDQSNTVISGQLKPSCMAQCFTRAEASAASSLLVGSVQLCSPSSCSNCSIKLFSTCCGNPILHTHQIALMRSVFVLRSSLMNSTFLIRRQISGPIALSHFKHRQRVRYSDPRPHRSYPGHPIVSNLRMMVCFAKKTSTTSSRSCLLT